MKKHEDGYLVEPEELEALEKGEKIKLEGESYPIDTGLTLYEMNQKLVKSMPFLDRTIAESRIYPKWKEWIDANPAHFYILICREGGEYTVFYNRSGNSKPGKFWDELWEVLLRIGQAYSIEPSPAGMEECVEIWALPHGEDVPKVYYLVNWDEGTIEL